VKGGFHDQRKHEIDHVVFAIVALLVATVPAAVAASLMERPLKEDLSGYATGIVYAEDFAVGDTFGERCSQPSQWISTSAGTGTISHLGRVSWRTEHCFQLFRGTFGAFGDAVLVVTSVNGDQLYGTYDGVMTGETTFVEEMIITGGTGRFAGASGVVTEAGWFDPGTGYMEITGDGWISYDASQRSVRQ
jgi:hypothetical protein